MEIILYGVCIVIGYAIGRVSMQWKLAQTIPLLSEVIDDIMKAEGVKLDDLSEEEQATVIQLRQLAKKMRSIQGG